MKRDEDAGQETIWTPGRLIATLVVAILIAILGYQLFAGKSSIEVEARVALPGAAAPEGVTIPPDFEIATIEGRTIKLSDYRGKVLVLDFWATWCEPCRREVPQLVRIARANQDKGLEIVGLHIDDQGRSTTEAIRSFIRQYDINYTVGRATNEMFIAYLGEKETAIPQTLVFGRDGRLVEHLVSYTDAHAKELDSAVNKALAGY